MVTYNILANLYADSDDARNLLYPYCPPYVLNIEYRRQLLARELLGYNADLLCLQEVDHKAFDLDLTPALRGDFEGDFAKKGGQVSEGCACFWRRRKFDLLFSERLVLSERLREAPHLSHILERVRANEALSESVLGRTTVLQVAALASKEVLGQVLVVGNTHLYFRPDADHIRLLQAGICAAELAEVARTCLEKTVRNGSLVSYVIFGRHHDVLAFHILIQDVKRCSVMLCGDFNSTPPFGVPEFLQTGHIPDDHLDWRSCPGEEVTGLELRHEFDLASACGTPRYTNFTVGFSDCLDYIFYPKGDLRVRQVVPFPSEEELRANVALPSVVFPSDHIACVADMEFAS